MPQLALQHTCPGAQVTAPQSGPLCGAGAAPASPVIRTLASMAAAGSMPASTLAPRVASRMDRRMPAAASSTAIGEAPGGSAASTVTACATCSVASWAVVITATRGDPASSKAPPGAFGHDRAAGSPPTRTSPCAGGFARMNGSVTITARSAKASASAAPNAAPLKRRAPVRLSGTIPTRSCKSRAESGRRGTITRMTRQSNCRLAQRQKRSVLKVNETK
jgi:hypothetical protein